jgi:hypothetical protein
LPVDLALAGLGGRALGGAGAADARLPRALAADPGSAKYRPPYPGRRPTGRELRAAYRHAQDLGLAFATVTLEDRLRDRSPLALRM